MSEPENSAEAAPALDLRPMSVHIGAEVHGLDLSGPLSPTTVAAIREALVTWKVLFFRGQSLDHESHIHFARYFGAPTPGHVLFGGDKLYPEIYSVAKHRSSQDGDPTSLRPWSNWHTDITPAINPPAASILRGVVVPPYGGDTLWTNLEVAYQHLSPALRGFLDGLRVVHRYPPPAEGVDAADYRAKIGAGGLSTLR